MKRTDFNILFPDNRREGETVMRQAHLVLLRMFKIIDYICRENDLKYWMCSGTLLGAVRHKGFIPWDDDLDICMIREDYERFVKIAVEEFPEDMMLQTRETDPNYHYLPLPCKVRDKKSFVLSPGYEDEASEKGLFIDIFPADRFHTDTLNFTYERFIKSYNAYISKGLNAYYYKSDSIGKKTLAFFHPVFHYLLSRYLKYAKKMINKTRDLGENSYVGHGFDTLWRRYFKYDDIYPLVELEFEDARFYAPRSYELYLRTLFGSDYMTPPPESERQDPKHFHEIKPVL